MAAISATDLTKRYGRTDAVDAVTFEISPGEIVGFLGPNGAGKTTTLRMLAGLIRPTRGTCTILDRPVPGPGLREVGTMIEEPSFYPYLSGRGNLRHAALLHGDVPPTRMDEVLAFVKLDRAAEKKVKAYSQGMRQRLGLARALLWKPRVLLLDEPTNGLDPVGIAEFRESLREIAATGVTILVSSHILAEIEKLVERILAIENGRLRYDGPLQGLMERLDDRRVSYRLESDDRAALETAAAALGLAPEAVGPRRIRVSVPRAEIASVLRSLAADVELLEARREGEDLEGAYLRLLEHEGGPR